MTRLLALLLVLSPVTLFAQSVRYEIAPGDKSVAEFRAEDTYDRFTGSTKNVSGTIVADASAPSKASVDVTIDMKSLVTGVAMRDREMRQRYLETNKFPTATFKSVSVAGPAAIAPNDPADVKVTGDFTLHGVTKRMTIPVRVVLIPDGNRVHATALFNVRMPDFGINVPDNILVTVNNEVPVRLDVWAAKK
jgi:polyisoprenoid-binding protein YceI